jgi:hypothetical protein
LHLDSKLDLVVDTVFLCDSLPVSKDLRALSVLLGPLGVGREAGLVDIGWYITAHPRISVLKPGAPLVCVRVEKRKVLGSWR